jgi:MarC family membrane protein
MDAGDIATAAVTLFFVMDPIGNIPLFNSVLKRFEARRRARIVARELVFALIILVIFLFAGNAILAFMSLSQSSLSIAGGVLLFIIALRMIFPARHSDEGPVIEDPFIVPLAMPGVAGPATIAMLLLLSSREPERIWEWGLALLIAWVGATALLTGSPFLMNILGDRGLRALERLTGMLLVLLATQMLLNGIAGFLATVDSAAGAETAAGAPRPLRYDTEYPSIGYSTTAATGAIAELEARLERGELALSFDSGRGYLDSVVAALGIGVESQVLVFSKTSLQVEGISAAQPRAIYFNDDTYVAWVPGGEGLEIATFDADLGPVFYTLAQGPAAAPKFERKLGECLRCHDSYSLTGGGVPRFITGSGYTDVNGNLVAHEGWILTSDRTPLRSRWGGWYVTGRHGAQVHLGNIAVRDVAELQRLEELRKGNLENLDALLDTSAYPSNRSDIVALLVLEHQVRVQNAITRASWDAHMALAAGATDETRIAAIAEPLVEALFLVDEAELTDEISGTSGFAQAFMARGPRDAHGRSLRELDLKARLFKYPLSYAIYSRAFDALPGVVKERVFARIDEILSGADTSAAYARFSAGDRATILEILTATKPDFAIKDRG